VEGDRLVDRIRFVQGWRHREVVVVLALGIISVLLWRLPMFGLLFYPFRLFNTFVHELSHGLAAIATGGAFRRFVVNPDLTGAAWSAGGAQWIVACAGYLGSAVFGGLLTILSSRNFSTRKVLFGMGLILGLLCLMFVRNAFGIVTGLAVAAAMCLAGQRLSRWWADGLLLLLAVQMMLNSVDSLFDLTTLATAAPNVLTDAQIMARTTGIPAVIWAVLWSVVALAILAGSLLVAYRRPPRRLMDQTPPFSSVTSQKLS